jgi:8-oxo-dGTP pyrophosphatase MutT (NUDIX family)
MINFDLFMNYKKFADSFSKVNDFPLPGLEAQLLAAPLDRQIKMSSKAVYINSSKKAAVLIYCYPKFDLMHLSLIKRSDYIGAHSGQISFPGGKPEPIDKKLEDTALRECGEELGIEIVNKNLFPLTPLYIPPSNFLVSPFITFDNFNPKFNLDKREVAAHIQIPLFKLMELQIEKKHIEQGTQIGAEVPCFCYENYIIWGATAMILAEFKSFLTSLSSN